jgi:hypothetical protein
MESLDCWTPICENFKRQNPKSKFQTRASAAAADPMDKLPRLMAGDVRISEVPFSDWSLNFEAFLRFGVSEPAAQPFALPRSKNGLRPQGNFRPETP